MKNIVKKLRDKNMRLNFYFAILLFLPFFSCAQNKDTWQLCYKNKVIASSKIGEQKLIDINDIKGYSLKVHTSKSCKDWKFSFVVMDTNRITVSTVETKTKMLKIDKNYFYDEAREKRPVVIYITEVPTDIKIAQNIRIAPRALVTLYLRN